MKRLASNQWVAIATAGSALLLAGAFVFQLLGYSPCQICFWQRWPHALAIVVGLIALCLGMGRRALAWLGCILVLTSAAFGLYHTGIERGIWAGPSSCTGSSLDSSGDLLSLEGPRVVMCDVVAWELFGLSMASWNALLSLILAAIWLISARRAR